MTGRDVPRTTIDPGPAAGFRPIRDSGESAWVGHLPFADWIVHALRPRVLVELGVHRGDSYSAFCQAAQEAFANAAERPACHAYGVDTWQGDAHAGFYGESVYEEFKAFHDRHFGPGGPLRSVLLRETFDEAARRFEPGVVDLLHIDGLHTYEATRHDFETWIGRMSDRGVVLLHDVTVRDRGFGVWRLWDEVSGRYPSFLFTHSFGLGVLGVGADCLKISDLRDLFDAGRTRAGARAVRRRFETAAQAETRSTRDHALGNETRWSYSYDFRLLPPGDRPGYRSVRLFAGAPAVASAESGLGGDAGTPSVGVCTSRSEPLARPGADEHAATDGASDGHRDADTAASASRTAERRDRIARLRRRFDRLQRILTWLDWAAAAAVLGWGAATQRWFWAGLGVLGLGMAAIRPGERLSAALLRTFVRRV